METKIDMSLEARIEYHKKLAEEYKKFATKESALEERAEYHKQYAEWLTELKLRRVWGKKNDNIEMSKEEAILRIKEHAMIHQSKEPRAIYITKALDKAIKALESQPEWIPVSDPLNELPKDKYLYVTTKYGDVESLHYDMTEWDDEDVARNAIAYMECVTPEPYKEGENK